MQRVVFPLDISLFITIMIMKTICINMQWHMAEMKGAEPTK